MNVSENKAQIQSVLEKRITAIHDRELENILAMYTPDVVTLTHDLLHMSMFQAR